MSSNPDQPGSRKANLWPMLVVFYAFCGALALAGVWGFATAIARAQPFWMVMSLVAGGGGVYLASAAVRSQLRMHRRDRS